MKRLLLIAVTFLLTVKTAYGQEVIPDFYKGPGLEPNRSYVNQSFHEHIDPFNGSLQLHYVDIHIPGNGGFDLQVTRSYNSAAVNESNPNAFFGSAGVGWSIHFGRVIYKSTIGPCGGSLYTDTLKDAVLELPDGSTQILASSAIAGATFISTRRWQAACTGSGMTVYSPDGIRYDLNQAVSVPNGTSSPFGAFYATRISDRNGNYATISYTSSGSPQVSTITTSDGRQVNFSYYAIGNNELTPRISTITSLDSTGNRVFTYGYTAIAGNFGGYQLTSVTRPDGTKWQYQYLGNLNATVPGGFRLNRVTYPEGGTIAYSYGSSSGDYVFFDSVNNTQSRTTVIKSKVTSDGGNWAFSYSPGAVGNYDTTTVATPSGTVTYRHIGPNYATGGSLWMVGLLMQKQIGSSQTETYNWASQLISNQNFKRPGAWQTTRLDSTTNAAVLTSKTIVRDGASHTTTYSGFDTYGNPSTVVESGPNGGSRTTSLTYYQNLSLWILHQVQNETVSNGGIQITRSFDGVGNLLSITKDGVSTTHRYYSDGSISQTTYPRSLTHSYSSYKRGVAQVETQPEGVLLSRSVSDSGNILSDTNGNSHTTAYSYDGLNRVTRITPPLGNVTIISYGAASKSATRGGLTETTLYDGFGRPASITLGGIARSYSHDSLSRLTFASNPNDTVGTSYQYDILDRVTFVTNSDASTRLITFGTATKTVRDERSNSTTYAFRAYGDPNQQFLMSVYPPDSSANIVIGRNVKDLVTSITQGGITRGYGYDGRGFLTSVTNPETGSTVYGRDDANNMTSRTVGTSGTTAFGYDGQNRLYSEVYPGSTPSVIKTYTYTHKLATATSSVATRGYQYDANENLISESLTIDGLGFGLTYGYNGNDQISSLTYPVSGRIVSYSPDVLGRPSLVSGFINGIGYWSSGQVSQINYANGTTSSYGQNNRLWPSSFQTGTNSVTYLSSSYGYDGLGNLTSITDSVDNSYNRGLNYDVLNRLNTISGPWGSGSLSYDGTGNLLTQSLGSSSLSYSYNSNNQLGSVSGSRTASYNYDAYGNVTTAGSRAYGYDGAPNMTCANCTDPMAEQYQYDGLNRRVSTIKFGVKTYEFYDFNGHLLVELTPSVSNRLVEHLYLGGKRIATVGPAPTSTSLPAQVMAALAGQTVTFTATVAGGAAPSGTVSFFDGASLLGTVPVAAGRAPLTTSFQTLGVHTLTATYSGDGSNFGSSTTATLTVLSSTTAAQPAGGTSPSAVASKPTTLSATVSGSSPTGTLTFYDGSTLLGTAALTSGTGTITTTFTTAGSHTITIVYSGDANNPPSVATVTEVVTLPPEQLVPILELLLDN